MAACPAKQSRPGKLAGVAALAWLVLCHPTLTAASSNTESCDETAIASVAMLKNELQKAAAGPAGPEKFFLVKKPAEKPADSSDALSPTYAQSPRAIGVLREMFGQTPVGPADSDNNPVLKTRIPGISQESLARHKRQMYRKDI